MSELVISGIYRHHKGAFVQVIGVARHSETLEELVVYSHPNKETGNDELWVRPKEMFLDIVEREGERFPRFELVTE